MSAYRIGSGAWWAWIAGLLLATTDVVRAAQDDAAPVQAVWKSQEIQFRYQSFTTFYSCSTLNAKIGKLLVALGAAQDFKVQTLGCSVGEIARTPRIRIHLTSPVTATPEALAELSASRSRRELAARVQGDSSRAAAAEEQFPAQWRRVSLSRGKLGLDPGDCELVEQLQRQVLPKLAVRILSDDLQCAPNQTIMGQPHLEIEVLTALPRPDAQ